MHVKRTGARHYLVDANVLPFLVVENDLSASAVILYERDDDWQSEPRAFVERE